MKRPKANDHTDQIDRLLTQAEALPHGATRIDLCEEAVRIADMHNDTALAYRSRQELMDAACFGGRPDLLIVTFSWCLSVFDRGEESAVAPYELLWRMKWVMGAIAKFPDVKLETLHAMLDDMERRFRDYSGSIQPVVGMRRTVAQQTGDYKTAAAVHKQFMRLPRSFLSDCLACELNGHVGYWLDIGKNVLGLRKGEELIDSGMRCAKVPDSTYADVLLPLLRVGRGEDAMRYHKKGYPLIRRDVSAVWHWGEHMAFLALTGNSARAVKLLEAHLPTVEASHDPLGSLAFFRNMLLTIEVLAERKEKMKLRLPAGSPFARAEGDYVLADLAAEVRKRAVVLSRQFDRRNGNSHHERLVDKAGKFRKWAAAIPY
ncbi:MAG TPA: hypothetical protein VHR66_14825 [Gemmataceae bacterium]|jgi:hypothetical protein|nr:hypothetical protein [Gemmataceae bacterium]